MYLKQVILSSSSPSMFHISISCSRVIVFRQYKDGEFLDLVNYAPDFKEILMSTQEKTLFAPSNEAIRQLPAEAVATIKTNITAITNVSVID
ncbi:hypothetical protein AVEN_210394-1 [Araneus ventricosus]|uniref:FAS1 domain-containing protein n=1 Tax=Araneus ventricosus TaxID=182803 RepID=A0A4Y2UM52_ARAVE|nr:hypothetical protein AVEN_210394-1 [Araneus ventricosus]